jgi:hypothetical protein
LAKEVGVDYIALKKAQMYNFEQANDLLLRIRSTRGTKKKGLTYKIKNGLLSHCWRMWQELVITWYGKVVPCCFDKDATYRLDQLENMTFKKKLARRRV